MQDELEKSNRLSRNAQGTGFESWEGIARRAKLLHPNLSADHPAFQEPLSLQAVLESGGALLTRQVFV